MKQYAFIKDFKKNEDGYDSISLEMKEYEYNVSSDILIFKDIKYRKFYKLNSDSIEDKDTLEKLEMEIYDIFHSFPLKGINNIIFFKNDQSDILLVLFDDQPASINFISLSDFKKFINKWKI